jgi:hypothetical protein
MTSRRWRYACVAALGAALGVVWLSGVPGGLEGGQEARPAADRDATPAGAIAGSPASPVPAAAPAAPGAPAAPAGIAGSPAQAASGPQGAGAVNRPAPRPARPALVSGVLTAPSSEDPVEIGRAFLASRPGVLAGADPDALALRQSVVLPRGHMLRYEQEHGGLRVVGSDTWVRLDEQGRVRWASSDARPAGELAALAPDLQRGPSLSERNAVDVFGHGAGYRRELLDAVDAAAAAHLVIYRLPNGLDGGLAGAQTLRLAWAVELPVEVGPGRMRKLRGYVDAGTGMVYAVDDQVRTQAAPVCPGFQDGFVYETNPVDADLSCVSLAGYLTPESTSLANTDVEVQNCVDRKGCRSFGDSSYHFCDFEATAAADQAGHYTGYVFESDTDAEDEFAEVQMFYHVNKALAVARGLGGFDNLDARPLAAVVNFRLPSFDDTSLCTTESYGGSEALGVFDNAAFVPAEGLLPGFPESDAILFGQGAASDFAYDGDVVYHELGHAVMARIAPDLPSMRVDALGLNTMPGGMHEGYADLMTMFVTNDPEIGEYAALAFGGEVTEIRNLANPATCPGWITGEVHDDSLPFTGAIWEARRRVATTAEAQAEFDQAVFAAQGTLGQLDDFGSAAQKTLAELELGLGAQAASTAKEVFDARGLLPDEARGMAACRDRVLDAANLGVPYLFLPGVEYFGLINQVPAPLQFRYELPERAASIDLDIGVSVGDSDVFGPGGEVEPAMALLVHGSEQPIRWSAAGESLEAEASHGTVDVRFSDLPDRPGLKRGTASMKGPFEPGVYHLQLANRGPTWIVAQLAVRHQLDRPGVAPGADDGCQVAPGGRGRNVGAVLLLLLGMTTLAVRWRRSAGRMRRLQQRDAAAGDR